MNKTHPFSPSQCCFRRSRRGVALISALVVLVLLTLLVVAFMSQATSSRASASLYRSTVNTRLLADDAVNIVQAQINEATTLGITGGRATYTWGSQPGAIRVFDNKGNINSVYRLYSAIPPGGGSPRVITATDNADAVAQMAADLPNSSNWTSYGSEWVDLNAPAQDSEGKYHFPILDPRDPAADPTGNPATVNSLWQPASGRVPLKGFSIQAPSSIGTSTNPAPMPVRWLYILKDGTMVAPDSPQNASNALTFTGAGSGTPSVHNPIVGRIAFWTDDESSKIDINTAAGDDVVRGSNQYSADSIFWATPSFSAPDEANLAIYQPVNGEIQRYPGHPGTVGLNSTLSILMGLATPLNYSDFYSLLPRYTSGGSQSATVTVPYDGSVAPSITPGYGRLFTSVAEMLFAKPSTTVTTRKASQLVADSLDATMGAERAIFFLTAHSASSELNLFGEPRVSIWPLTTAHGGSSAAQSQTPIDQLLSFDSTVAKTATGSADLFYFQRTDATSSTTDCNIANNQSILNYLNTLTGTSIPGFGGTFTDKYPGDANNTSTHQILSEIFDYVRTINMIDPVLLPLPPTYGYGSSSPTYGQNWGASIASVNPYTLWPYNYRNACGGFQVVPSANAGKGVNGWHTQGVGSFPYPIEVAFDFTAEGLGQTGTAPNKTPEQAIPWQHYSYGIVGGARKLLAVDTNSTPGATDNIVDDTTPNGGMQSGVVDNVPPAGKPADGTTAVQAFVYAAFVNPAQVTSHNQPMFCYSLTGLDSGISVTDSSGNKIPLYFPGNVANTNGSAPAVSSSDEERMVVDNSDGAGFINGWYGSWIFGYIPFIGEMGNSNYGSNPAMLSPGQTDWNIYHQVTLAAGSESNGQASNLSQICRYFPFYSQIFGLTGQQTPGQTNLTFNFSGVTLTLKMYDANHDGQDLTSANVVSSYQVVFPAATFPLPAYSTSDDHIVGTQDNAGADRWHISIDSNQGSGYIARTIPANDTVESVTLSPAWSDARDLAIYSATGNSNASIFVAHPNYGVSSPTYGTSNMAHNLQVDTATVYTGNYDPHNWGSLVNQPNIASPYHPIVPPRLNGSDGSGKAGMGAFTTTGVPGDWDNGVAFIPDGPWVNMADEGALVTNLQQGGAANSVPYYSSGNTGQKTGIASTFSPNRQIPSPAMFGSLPTGIISGGLTTKPWQTLLFRPGAGAGGFPGGKFHPGEANQPNPGDPADHMLLDLFWMPQAEPYPISQPFVTEGKINLNYEIQPFTYITRVTALRALLGTEKIALMPDALAATYKVENSAVGVTAAQIVTATGKMDVNGNSRLPIDVDQTLGLNPDPTADPHAPTSGITTVDTAQTGGNAWYDSQAKLTRFFRSESELCDMFLVPQGYDWKEFSGATFDSHSWYETPNGDFALVGDNNRERPYTDLYSRVTTKSNTYTVYDTVQSLKNAQPLTDAAQATWNEARGAVTGEYRGSTVIERYLDPNETMPDFLGNPTVFQSLEPYYKWRVVATRQFAP